MNRKKKTFTPGMRMAALYLLMGVLLLLAVTLFSGQKRSPSGLPALPYWTKTEKHCVNIQVVMLAMRSLRSRCGRKPR